MFAEQMNRARELYNKKKFDEALDVYEELKNIDYENFMKACSLNYMWCLYRTKIKTGEAFLPENKAKTKNYLKFFQENCSSKDLVFRLTVFAVIRYLKSKPNFPADHINTWLDKLNPEDLPDEPQKAELYGEQKVFKSYKEEWYALKSKACEKLEMYNECLRISEDALRIIPELHDNNDIWFKWRIAISKHNLGMKDKAIEILTDLLKYKKEWFIYKELSAIYLALDDYEKALDNSIDAVLRPGDDDKKVNLYWLAGTIFQILNNGDAERVMKNYTVKLRLSNEWKLSPEEAQHYNDNKELVDSQQVRRMKKQVQEIAETYKWKNKEKHQGIIAKILQTNKAGFIKSGNNSYFFRMNDIQGKRGQVQVGRKVEFLLENGFDLKKKIETKNAVFISIME